MTVKQLMRKLNGYMANGQLREDSEVVVYKDYKNSACAIDCVLREIQKTVAGNS